MSDPRYLCILHVTVPAPVGGLEQVVTSLAIGQRGRGHEVTVAAVVDAPGSHPFVATLEASSVPVERLVVPPRYYWKERKQVEHLCRQIRPDVVHLHGYRPDVLDGAVARRSGAAIISTVHGFTAGDWKNRLFEWLDRRALRQFDRVVAVSKAQLQLLQGSGIAADRLVHIANAWTPRTDHVPRQAARRALGLPEDAWVLGWVGRLSNEKGPDVLLDALPRIRTANWIAAMLGDGPQRPHLTAKAAALGDSKVHWKGVVHDAARLYRAFDVFVLSSRTEGIPIVLFEAMAARTPIVATRVGGVPEVVGEAEALLVPSEDPAAIAAAIDRIAADPPGAERRAAAALDVLQRRFAVEPWLAAYDDAYRSAIAHRQL